MRRRGLRVGIGVLGGLLVALTLPTPATAAGESGAVTVTKIVTRDHLVNGQDDVVDTLNIKMTVSQTQNLRGRQEIDVSWSGAHPTGGIIADLNSGNANQEEYPFVLLECRGVDSPSEPVAQRLTPSTCWTQTSGERFQFDFNSAFPPWRLDRYAAEPQRAAVVGAPDPRPGACSDPALAEYWVPLVSASGATYYGGQNACAGLAPEAANAGDGLGLPSNTTYGVTTVSGSGSTKFVVWNAEDNATLGCTDTVPCALVAVPIMGISCDTAAAGLPVEDQPAPGTEADQADASCKAAGKFKPGSLLIGGAVGGEDLSVSGGLWWSASNWLNRLSVPLRFAPLSNVCDLVTSGSGVDIYGSELMIQATAQWAPTFCLDPRRVRFKHVQTGEPQARSLVDVGTVEASLISDPPPNGYTRPIVDSPVAVTGFAIGYTIDDASGNEYRSLRLNARLLAKLLTESYPAAPAVKEEDSDLAHNPLEISQDPEFIALNPGLPQGVNAGAAAATLLALSSDSDVIYALTSYINEDPDARAWLDGDPDPWGMVVNSNYKKILLPVNNWPVLDTFEPAGIEQGNDCLRDNPVPFLPLVASPMSRLSDISLAMQFSLANSQIVCSQPVPGSSIGQKLTTLGRQTAGFRFMLGLVSMADAQRYQIDTAALQTQVAEGTPTKFTSSVGRSFSTASDDSLRAAMSLTRQDPTTHAWTIPYAALRTSATGKAAYPGTMVVYAAVPTQGLPAKDAKAFADLLRFAAGPGQTPGGGNGQLPSGYLPMTKANGLGALVSYALHAADQVAAQKGNSGSSTGGSSGGAAGGPGPTQSSAPSPTTPSPSVSSLAGASTAPLLPVGSTTGLDSRLARYALPAVLLIAVLGFLLGPVVAVFGRRRGRR